MKKNIQKIFMKTAFFMGFLIVFSNTCQAGSPKKMSEKLKSASFLKKNVSVENKPVLQVKNPLIMMDGTPEIGRDVLKIPVPVYDFTSMPSDKISTHIDSLVANPDIQNSIHQLVGHKGVYHVYDIMVVNLKRNTCLSSFGTAYVGFDNKNPKNLSNSDFSSEPTENNMPASLFIKKDMEKNISLLKHNLNGNLGQYGIAIMDYLFFDPDHNDIDFSVGTDTRLERIEAIKTALQKRTDVDPAVMDTLNKKILKGELQAALEKIRNVDIDTIESFYRKMHAAAFQEHSLSMSFRSSPKIFRSSPKINNIECIKSSYLCAFDDALPELTVKLAQPTVNTQDH